MGKSFLQTEEFYKDLVIRFLSDRITPEEKRKLEDWLGQSSDNHEYYKNMKETWEITTLLQDSSRFNSELAWQKTASKIKTGEKNNDNKKMNVFFVLRIAAVFLLAFFLGGIASYYFIADSTRELAGNINEVETPLGSRSKVFLPDGTSVWLNAGSKISYSQNYNATDRQVKLQGEAYFDVETNPGKPFVVQTSEMNVTAYGTQFNVKAYPNEPTITATLVEGNIKIKGNDNISKEFEVVLKPNQTLTYVKEKYADTKTETGNKENKTTQPSKIQQKKSIVVDKDVKTDLYTSWKDDKWIIEGEKLDELVVKLERRFDVKFIYKSESLKKYTISGIIRKETLEQVLDILKLTAPLKYTIKEGIVTLEMDDKRIENYSKVMN